MKAITKKAVAQLFIVSIAVCALFISGCPKAKKPSGGDESKGKAPVPVFSLAWSEYPSWSTFGVAHELGLINGKRREMGEIEKKWNVDIELKEADYDSCLVMYGSNKVDAACITNMDALNPSLSVPSVAILPTSTSYGADALITTNNIKDIKQLQGKKVYGLAKTVSEYCFVRNLEIRGENEKNYSFTNMDPAAAALAMQQKNPGYEAIVVWNPFVLETLNKRPDTKVMFDSKSIPGEIVDMVVMTQAALDKPGGENFAKAVIDTYYTINKRIADPATRDETLVMLGEKFSHLDLESMKKVVEQTKFYSTPGEGLAILKGDSMKDIMKKVAGFCASHDIVPKEPSIGYGNKASAPKAAFRLDPTYIDAVAGK